MSDQLLMGFPEIANALRCSVRKLHMPHVKKELIAKGVIFKRKTAPYGNVVWAAFYSDLAKFQKEKAAKGEPF